MEALNHLKPTLSIAFHQTSKASADVGGDLRLGIRRSSQQDVDEAQRFDQCRAFKQKLNPPNEERRRSMSPCSRRVRTHAAASVPAV